MKLKVCIKKIHLQISSAIWWPFCQSLNVVKLNPQTKVPHTGMFMLELDVMVHSTNAPCNILQ